MTVRWNDFWFDDEEKPQSRKPRSNKESVEQRALFEWKRAFTRYQVVATRRQRVRGHMCDVPCAWLPRPGFEDLMLMFAVPNGFYASARSKQMMVAEGLEVGILDVWLPVARGPYKGMAFEFKAGANKLTPAQALITNALIERGWYVPGPFKEWHEAAVAVAEYLDLPSEAWFPLRSGPGQSKLPV